MGKSTLLNLLVGSKVAITSPRPQTTRNRIIGILSRPALQIVFVDTPGVGVAKSKLGKSIMESSINSSSDSDLLLFVTDASNPDVVADRKALHLLGRKAKTKFLLLNKIDLVNKESLLGQISELSRLEEFSQVAPVSAKTGENLGKLVELIGEVLPEGPFYYPEDMVTDQPEKFVIGEIIREKAFFNLQKEMPYSIAALVDSVEDRQSGAMVIGATLFVERESQKGIVIGKQGQMLGKIGTAARKELEKRFDTRVFLELRVSVKKKWTADKRIIHEFGYGRGKGK